MKIGNFTLSRDGGWIGFINTLTIHAKVRLVLNDDKTSDKAPAFRVLLGNVRIGDAWETQTSEPVPKYYISVRIDDPSLGEPIKASLFPSDSGNEAKLVWNRRKEGEAR